MRPSSRTTVKADAVLPVGAEQARDALTRIFTAADLGRTVRLSVGPGRGTHGIAKHVAATLTAPRLRGTTYVFELHWTAVGFAARVYPTLDANLGITTVDGLTSLLSIVAAYAPPLGAVGATADRAGLSRVAEATVVSLVQQLAADITNATRTAVGV